MGRGARIGFIILAALIAWGAVAFKPPSWVYLAAFAVIFLFYANTFTERVPLYLTNRTTWAALAQMLDEHTAREPGKRPSFIDLGCGLGGTVAYLARAKPDWDVFGVETAPGAYLIAKARTAFVANAHVRYQSLWKAKLARFDVAYAFLSPAPMPRLHAKAGSEMRPGALFVSNSFWADDQPFDGVVEVNDARATRLVFLKIK